MCCYRTKLDRVGEQLASQHARILGYQQSERVTNTEMECDLGDERLVEQQLRIKQVCIYNMEKFFCCHFLVLHTYFENIVVHEYKESV